MGQVLAIKLEDLSLLKDGGGKRTTTDVLCIHIYGIVCEHMYRHTHTHKVMQCSENIFFALYEDFVTFAVPQIKVDSIP